MEIRERPPSMKKHQWWAPWEVLNKIRERPPSTQKTSMVGPLKGAVEDLGAPTIKAKIVNSRPLGPHGAVRSPSRIQKVCCKPAWV
jgi:hypothetical protein